MTLLAVLAAGVLGTFSRYGLDRALRRLLPRQPTGPILLINAVGSCALGALTGLVLFHGMTPRVKTIAGTGFCSSFTTFSTAIWETLSLLRQRRIRAAALHAIGTLVATTGAAGLGLLLLAA